MSEYKLNRPISDLDRELSKLRGEARGVCRPRGWRYPPPRIDVAAQIARRDVHFIYATLLPTNIVKIGHACDPVTRGFAAQTYHVDPVVILGVWPLAEGEEGRDAERIAHAACSQWRVRPSAELFYNTADWLDIELPVVRAISDALKCEPVIVFKHWNPPPKCRTHSDVHRAQLGIRRPIPL